MKNTLRKIINPIVPKSIKTNLQKQKLQREYAAWKANDCPLPPPHLAKQKAIQSYQKKYNINTLVETGTYMGDMVAAQIPHFEKIISIELGVDLHKQAQQRFKNQDQVLLLQGDSGKVMPQVMDQIDETALFWLDGHYSAGKTAKGDKECPIFEEVDAIFDCAEHPHILLVDDARCFVGKGDYPTIDELTQYIHHKNKKYKVEVKHDIIRYTI